MTDCAVHPGLPAHEHVHAASRPVDVTTGRFLDTEEPEYVTTAALKTAMRLKFLAENPPTPPRFIRDTTGKVLNPTPKPPIPDEVYRALGLKTPAERVR